MSFKKREQGLEHQTDLNNIPAPDALEDDKTRVERFVRDNPDYKRPPIADAFQTFEFRTNGELPSLRKGSSEPTQGFGLKPSNQ